MWSSEDTSTNRYTTSSSSKSSSTSSSSSPFSPSPLFSPPCRKRTMEDVWKDINLASFQDPPRGQDAGPRSSYRRTILQEFLARPFGGQPHSKAAPHVDPSPDMVGIDAFASDPAPATALSLTSGPEFQYLESPGLNNSHPFRNLCGGNIHSPNFVNASAGGSPFDVMESSLSKSRITEPADKCMDRRHKRMIKNRESAARSRARKQAYTNELELEVASLLEENAKLRKLQQQQQISVAAAAHLPQRRGLCRTLTAPF
ncbi:hypothetical protein H6P81_018635 [Aristolochia fimbriata]|uniref:BZIP domain-containing protein n=1 Tax=Aristolochia fimbriata TaxID=158543 RepID=A0AAV7E4L7_ARIFI|nr:hypothetical protein H6P81_018635 [Aristolochia fimbriata]